MITDIESRKDIELMVNTFYEKVKSSTIIGFIFNDVEKVNWQEHLPVMYNFWENTLFFTGSYNGNPMLIHQQLNQRIALTTEHFTEWLYLFTNTVDELFEGERAELAKQRAISISTIMKMKILHNIS